MRSLERPVPRRRMAVAEIRIQRRIVMRTVANTRAVEVEAEATIRTVAAPEGIYINIRNSLIFGLRIRKTALLQESRHN